MKITIVKVENGYVMIQIGSDLYYWVQVGDTVEVPIHILEA